MEKTWLAVTKKCFRIICVALTISIMSWCIYRYHINDDVSMVSFESFHYRDTFLYPSTTLCFYNPFLEQRLENYGKGINITSYSEFLQGKYSDDRMYRINYDDVTRSAEDFLLQMSIKLEDGTTIMIHDANNQSTGIPPHQRIGGSFYSVNYRSGIKKCFSFNVPYMRRRLVWSLFIKFKADIFPRGRRPVTPNFDGSNSKEGGFMVSFHYPNQYYRSFGTWKYLWESITHRRYKDIRCSGYYMRFRIKGIEVLERRDKPLQPCNNDWLSDDQNLTLRLKNVVGCQVRHEIQADSNLPICSHTKDIAKILTPSHDEIQMSPGPCKEIKRLKYEYEEGIELPPRTEEECMSNANNWYLLKVYFGENTFKQIRHVRDYDFKDLFGNISGHVGFVLGWSFLQFPPFLIDILCFIKTQLACLSKQ